MNDKQRVSSLSLRRFGNCKIVWIIDEFGFPISERKWVVCSPEFIVRGLEETKFSMTLQLQKTVHEDIFTFCLKRSMIDEGPEVVYINMILFYSISKVKNSFPTENLFCLKKGSEIRMRLTGLKSINVTLTNTPFKLVCKILVYSKGGNGKFKECKDVGLRSLSEDMLKLYTSGKHSDVKLNVQNNIILAHKCILLYRNDFLSDLIGMSDESWDDESMEESFGDVTEEEDYVIISDVEYSAMKKILAYLYSGNLKHALEAPSHAIHDCATLLGITEVEEIYKPDELTLRSSSDNTKLTFVVFCPPFNRLCNYLHFKVYFDEYELDIAKLNFSFDPGSNVNYSVQYCDKRNVCANRTRNTNIEVAIFDKHDTCLFAFSLSRCSEENFKICEIIKPTLNVPHSTDNLLKLTLTLKLFSGSRNSQVINEITNCITYDDEDFTYEDLSYALQYMLDMGSSMYRDISFLSNTFVRFNCHACILAARSRFFSDFETGSEITINMESHILCKVLHYLYCGIVSQDTSDDCVIELYKTAVKIGLPLLNAICSDRLKKSIKTNRTLRCRVMKIAEENNDRELKKYVIDQLLNTVSRFPVPIRNSFSDVEPCRHC